MLRTTLAATALAGLMLAGGTFSLQAAPMTVKADLTSGAETPPNTSKGMGTLTGTYDPSSKKLTYDITYSDLTGPATAAHFHAPAPVGKPAGIEIPIKGSVTSPIKGEATLTADQAKNLTDGMTYFNVHTAANKMGEIRGQVMLSK